jgi:DNA-binding transcriptional ArsR family regulator
MGSAWKALSDDNRREILMLLRKRDMTPTEMAEHFHFTLPALSTHLRILKDADLVTETKEGKNRFYALNNKKTLEIITYFEQIWNYNLRSLKEYVENKEKTRQKK